ncbi:macro domain-containing protein [Pontibacter sp. G13]|uniref:macro domain-containing protein n=1 Tax=Pontibacter sp. G13 TaxID=3074898 RepID=UPI002889BEE1|nr:macro domain-containing protein [Pontibacter sp. G13]WNJ19477.1 macro domain-containing protein [Pontibacter sp. G13]
MQINLIDLNHELTHAWNRVFEEVPHVEVHTGSIFDHPSDALISPANSFGFMNGGIDFAISKNLGWHVEKRVQQRIRNEFYGELLIGQALIVPTDHADFPYLISAPTMRTPMTIRNTPNVYLAMKSILVLAMHGRFEDGTPVRDQVSSLAIPGLGTGVGQVPPLVCARQMRIAYEDVMGEKHASLAGWEEMRSNWAYFFTSDKRNLKYDIP